MSFESQMAAAAGLPQTKEADTAPVPADNGGGGAGTSSSQPKKSQTTAEKYPAQAISAMYAMKYSDANSKLRGSSFRKTKKDKPQTTQEAIDSEQALEEEDEFVEPLSGAKLRREAKLMHGRCKADLKLQLAAISRRGSSFNSVNNGITNHGASSMVSPISTSRWEINKTTPYGKSTHCETVWHRRMSPLWVAEAESLGQPNVNYSKPNIVMSNANAAIARADTVRGRTPTRTAMMGLGNYRTSRQSVGTKWSESTFRVPHYNCEHNPPAPPLKRW